ncbi:DNA polymerase III subunit alpha [Nocardioides marmoraquaticus]
MPDPFVHLHVASGYSLRHGTAHPHLLVQRAAELEMDAMALTDRDGLYGAVRFVKAAAAAGVAPVLGVDLATPPLLLVGAPARARTPARGGTERDPRLPRVTFLAQGDARGAVRPGWAALCRLVSAAHAAGRRGSPLCPPALGAEHVAGHAVQVVLGPGSELGRAVALRRDDLAAAVLRRWLALVGPGQLAVELVSHRLPGAGPGTAVHAARMLGLATRHGVATVLTNAVRFADRLDAPVADVLDATRRLVPLDRRHLDRRNAEGFCKSGKQMQEVAEEVCRRAGVEADPVLAARSLLARTRSLAERCVLDPGADLGLGEVHFPELEAAVRPGDPPGADADAVLRRRCEDRIGARYGDGPRMRVWTRLDHELDVIRRLGYASYFLTVGEVTEMVRGLGIRSAARGSGAGSLVNYLLGVSGIDPIRHGLLFERFLSPLRRSLPDIDLDVESARRLEVYDAVLARFGRQRCATVAMVETYRVRHAVRDVGAALGLPHPEVDALATAFPHVRARDARAAVRDLPELRPLRRLLDAGAGGGVDLGLVLDLVERLDGLPRHVAMHPCGVLLSDLALLDRTPVEQSAGGYPMSQFDKDDVEDLGLLKLDLLGIRMQSAMAHAVAEVERVEGVRLDLDDEAQVPLDDLATYEMISSAQTLGVFQIESPGQRELVGRSGIDDFADIVADISLFRPGPVKSDMITPYLEAKQGWRLPGYLHPDLEPILRETRGVVVFHEQVIAILSEIGGCTLAEADERRRAMGTPAGMAAVEAWFVTGSRLRGYDEAVVRRLWEVVASFASFGFCKAHAAAFALPTYQSAWLKTHWPAHFLAGVLTHDPGMYPKRLLLDDARRLGIAVLGVDVNRSRAAYAVEHLADGGHGIRVALAEVRGIDAAEVDRVLAARDDAPYASLGDFVERARVSRPVVEHLVLAGGFDAVHDVEPAGGGGAGRRARTTRRDLLLEVGDLDRMHRAGARTDRWRRARDLGGRPPTAGTDTSATSVQLALGLPTEAHTGVGLPEMSPSDRVGAELEVLGLDVSRHVMHLHHELVEALGVTRSTGLLEARNRSELLVAGVKVATQTPPIRSGRRVVFVTLDDSTGPVDATLFDDAQGDYASTVFGSWLLVVRGVLRRTGRRGVSLRATGAWDLGSLTRLWEAEGLDAVLDLLERSPRPGRGPSATPHRVRVHPSGARTSPYADLRPAGPAPGVVSGAVARRLWHRSPGSPG